jgi:phosphate uptake regulator
MLTELLKAWSKRDLLRRIFDEFIQMLEISHGMFEAVCEVLEGKRDLSEVKIAIYEHDREINKLEQTIRTQLLEHLTLRPGVDISACLVLMSVVKDAERLGDYCKNLIEVAEMYNRKLTEGRYVIPLLEIKRNIDQMFAGIALAFGQSDEIAAHSINSASGSITQKCDLLLQQLIRDNLPTDKAVAYTLLTRYFKRISAHLSNIATSVLVPLPRLDYHDEPRGLK